MMNKHTAGPWRYSAIAGGSDHIVNVIPSGGGRVICKMSVTTEFDVAVENARLIAAAPDLLEALQGFLDMYVRLINNDGSGACDPEKEPQVIAARAAIAKATK